MSSPTSNRLVRCVACGRAVTKNNLRTHYYGKKHEARFPGFSRRPLAELYVELGDRAFAEAKIAATYAERAPHSLELGLPPAELELDPSVRGGGGSEVPTVGRPSASELPPLGPEDVDEIVLAVVDQLAEPAGLLPVVHLAAVFAWRDATSTFLRSVRGSESHGEASRRP